jgi:predicted secreted hydrolase
MRRYGWPVLAAGLLVVALWLFRSAAPEPRVAVAEQSVVSPAVRERTAVLRPVNLPADDGPHADKTEWWYYTGHLRGEGGEHYAFHVAVFLREGVVRHTVFHGSVTDVAGDVYHMREMRTAGLPTPVNVPGYDFAYRDWRVKGGGPDHLVRVTEKAFALELKMRDEAAPVLHAVPGSTTPGLLDFGDTGISYYYSRPRMLATGWVRTGKSAPVKVSGEVWFDHQWGDFEASDQRWNWFALHLDDGSSLMVYQLFDNQGRLQTLAGTRTLNGHSHPLGEKDIRLEPVGAWRSPRSRITYPAGWRLQVGGESLVLTPLRLDSEFNGLETTFAYYWEGGMRISGSRRGEGFVEMYGYGKRAAGE